jgi:hypothetical protein
MMMSILYIYILRPPIHYCYLSLCALYVMHHPHVVHKYTIEDYLSQSQSVSLVMQSISLV